MGREILTRMLERKLEEKEDEIREFQSYIQEEIQKDLQNYDEQIESMKRQITEMNATIEGLTRELLDQKKIITELKARPKGPMRGGWGGLGDGRGEVEVLSRHDDAIVMVRRR